MTTKRQSEVYGVHVKTICQWKNDGLRVGFPCPLDTPEHMPEWWGNMVQAGEYSKSCPVKMLVAAGQAGAPPQYGGDDDDGDLSAMEGMDNNGFDYASAVDYAQTNLKAIKVLLDSAILAKSEKKIVALQRSFKDAQDTLRSLRKDRGKIELESGETLLKSEVRAEWLKIHGNITKRFRQGIRQAFPNIHEHSATVDAWNVFADGIVDKICMEMNGSNYAE